MAAAATVKLPCKCCRAEQPHQKIPAMSAGQDYLECTVCRTVQHKPRSQEAAS